MRKPKVLSFFLLPTPLAFCIRLVTLITVLTLITLTGPFKTLVEEPLIIFNAWLANIILALFGSQTVQTGSLVSSPGFTVEVVSGCTGIFVFLMLLGAIIAFPAGWRRKAAGALIGAALVFVLNQLRIVSLFALGHRYPELFEDIHLYIWQGVTIAVAGFYWYFWAARSFPRLDAPKA